MKKVMLFLIVLIFSIGISAQTTGVTVGKGTVWSDSVGYSGSGADSVVILDMKFSKNWLDVFLECNANDPVDSIAFYPGLIRYNNARVPIDTLWGSMTTLVDSLGDKVNVGINKAATVSVTSIEYLLWRPVTYLLKVELLNHRATLTTRKVGFSILATEQK